MTLPLNLRINTRRARPRRAAQRGSSPRPSSSFTTAARATARSAPRGRPCAPARCARFVVVARQVIPAAAGAPRCHARRGAGCAAPRVELAEAVGRPAGPSSAAYGVVGEPPLRRRANCRQSAAPARALRLFPYVPDATSRSSVDPCHARAATPRMTTSERPIPADARGHGCSAGRRLRSSPERAGTGLRGYRLRAPRSRPRRTEPAPRGCWLWESRRVAAGGGLPADLENFSAQTASTMIILAALGRS